MNLHICGGLKKLLLAKQMFVHQLFYIYGHLYLESILSTVLALIRRNVGIE